MSETVPTGPTHRVGEVDEKRLLRPYGDTTGDGMVQAGLATLFFFRPQNMTDAAGVAAALVVVVPASNLILALAAFTVVGVANSLFFAATLAARSEYSPLESRGQVFIWVGALKIAAGSAGTAVAGALAGAAVWLPIAAVAVLSAASSLWCVMERRRAGAG